MKGPFMQFDASARRGKVRRVLPVVALVMTAVGLVSSSLLGALVLLGIVAVPWGAVVLPRLVLWGLVTLSVLGLSISGVSWCLYRDAASGAALILGLLAIVSALGTFFVIVVAGIASHPI
jgi:hypothetical protein